MLYQNRRILASDDSFVKIALWVYIADKIESDLAVFIEHLRSKMGSGECEEVLKPVFVAQFGKVVFHGVMGIYRKLELHKMEMKQVHYSVIGMSYLDKNLDLRLMLSTKRIFIAQPEASEASDDTNVSINSIVEKIGRTMSPDVPLSPEPHSDSKGISSSTVVTGGMRIDGVQWI
ncbi:hypothetical protein GIB67_041611 [Kingdonia uniflora]|uniref:DUF7903 domain-containing protein n=1 Tax=Kingdonia uniflora TaxID=39325 RepID=A0A7J7MQS0_9MAGN|nr:hypothetical protein GIB67_041611 [Kingdonia uniflora]